MKAILRLFKKKPKWKPFGSYTYGSIDYIIFARKNPRNGIIQFKYKVANPTMHKTAFLPTDLIDTKKAWEELIG